MVMEVRFFAGKNKNANKSAHEKNDARPRARARPCAHSRRKLAPCKKAESNHDQARIWTSKVRVRMQLRTRNAITRVSKSPLQHPVFSVSPSVFLSLSLSFGTKRCPFSERETHAIYSFRPTMTLATLYSIFQTVKNYCVSITRY